MYFMELSLGGSPYSNSTYPNGNPLPVPITKLQTPTSDIIVVGSWGDWVGGSWILDNMGCFTNREEGAPTATKVVVAAGHNAGGNVSYADGHAKWLPSQIIGYNITTETNCSNNFGGAGRAFGKCVSALHE